MKKIFLPSLSSIVSLLLIGCGGGSSSSNNTSTSLKEIKVIDGYVINAKVCDSEGQCGITGADGIVRANFHKNSILTSVGGKIDVNFNGIADADEPTAPTMKSKGSLISPITTLVVDGIDIDKLSALTGLTSQELLTEDPIQTNNVKLIKLFNAFYPLLKEDRVSKFISLVNNLNLNGPNTALPSFNETTSSLNIYNLVKASLTKREDISFVQQVEDMPAEGDAKTLSQKLDKDKINLQEGNIYQSSGVNTPTSTNINPVITTNSTSNANPINTTNPSTNNTANGGGGLPDFNNPNNTAPGTVVSSSNTALPNVNGNVNNIPTNNQYNPSYSPVPPIYEVKLNSLGRMISLDKVNDTEYKLKNPLYVNIHDKDFNVSTLFDINSSYIFQNLKFKPDGNLDGTARILLNDKNDSSNAKINITNITYKVVDQNMTKADLSNITYEVNQSTDNNYTDTIDAGTYTGFDINLSKAYNGLDEKEYNQTNHLYDFTVEYNVSGEILTLEGQYKVVDITPPVITLNNNYFILEKGKDINISIGTSNVDSVPCSIDGVDLSCEVNGSGDILLQGKVPSNIGVILTNITIDNQGMKDTKSFYSEIVNPINNPIVKDWNLSDENYSGYHIEMNLTGSLDNNIIDVNTTLSDVPSGSPENNVTVYLLNSSSDSDNYIKFVFDANVYGPNEAFRLSRKDGKSVTFRVGDIDSSHNSYYFK